MTIEVNLEENEEESPIRFATAIIERCMNFKNFYPDNIDANYHYLKTVNEHIDVFLKNLNYKGIDSE